MTKNDADCEPDWATAAEVRVLEAALPLAATLGWRETLVAAAARAAGLSPADALLLLPNGAGDLAALLARRHDSAALAALATVDAGTLKIRERIRTAVQARIDAALVDEAAVRACTRWLAQPPHLPLAGRLAWASADGLWRWAGDTATDANHYSKRAILTGVLTSTLAVRLARGEAAAADHLDARIANVMAFEVWKAKLPDASGWGTAAAGLLGRLRYGAR